MEVGGPGFNGVHMIVCVFKAKGVRCNDGGIQKVEEVKGAINENLSLGINDFGFASGRGTSRRETGIGVVEKGGAAKEEKLNWVIGIAVG
jgi:hypothetical protein